MKKRYLVLQPDYMRQFKCIGNDCKDNCCHGWNIDIDKKTFKNYRKIDRNNPMKKMINKNVILNKEIKTDNQYAQITLNSTGNCPFLNEKGLCEIYINCGESHLSRICNQYPRIVNSVDNCIEKSCQISCPEVAKLLFNEDLMSFDQFYDEIDIDRYSVLIKLDTNSDFGMSKHLWPLREMSINILQDRNFSIEERMFILGLIINNIQKSIDNEEIDNIEDLIKTSMEKYCNKSITEYMNTLKYKDSAKIDIINLVCNIKTNNKNNIDSYNKLFINFLEGISYDESNFENCLTIYNKGYENLYCSFFNDREYVLENYLVNEVFLNLFPMKKGNNVFEEYCILAIKFSILKVLLIGVGNFHKELNEDIVVKTLYLYSRNIEHTNGYFDFVLESIKENNNLNMGYVSLLIRK